MENWQKYRKALFYRMTFRRLLFLFALLPIFILLDYKWGEGLMMGETIWGFLFYLAISLLYLFSMLSLDFIDDFRKNSFFAFAFVVPCITGIVMIMYIIWTQQGIHSSLDPRAATAIVAWRWNALIYVLIFEACINILLFTFLKEEKMKEILKTNKKELMKFLGGELK